MTIYSRDRFLQSCDERQMIAYKNMVDGYLEKIPFETLDDFEVAISALKALSRYENRDIVSSKLNRVVMKIQDLLREPELYVEQRQDDSAFKQIILTQIASKINFLEKLTRENRIEKISEYQKNQNDRFRYPLRLNDSPLGSVVSVDQSEALKLSHYQVALRTVERQKLIPEGFISSFSAASAAAAPPLQLRQLNSSLKERLAELEDPSK